MARAAICSVRLLRTASRSKVPNFGMGGCPASVWVRLSFGCRETCGRTFDTWTDAFIDHVQPLPWLDAWQLCCQTLVPHRNGQHDGLWRRLLTLSCLDCQPCSGSIRCDTCSMNGHTHSYPRCWRCPKHGLLIDENLGNRVLCCFPVPCAQSMTHTVSETSYSSFFVFTLGSAVASPFLSTMHHWMSPYGNTQ